jgi:C_GCAxxG_C_C family probable redox protein
MGSRAELAIDKFKSGFNCAQAIVVTYASPYGISEETALRMSAGFGAGMGRLQDVCGALTGAIMIAGLQEGMTIPGDRAAKERTYALVQRIAKAFEKEHGARTCRDLVGCDMNTEEGMKDYREREAYERVCSMCVRTAARLVEERNVSKK